VLQCYGLAAAGKKSAKRPPLSPVGVRRRMERNRQKPVGRDKGSLTEQPTKGTGTTTIQIRRKHNTNHTTHRAAPKPLSSQDTREFPPPRSPPPEPSMTAHGVEYPALFGQVRSALPALPLPGFW